MGKQKNLLFSGIASFILFILLSFLVHLNIFTQTDFSTTLNLQDMLPSFLITPFSVFSILGSVELATLFLLVLWAFSIHLKKFFVLFFYGLTGVVELFSKSVIEHYGPPIEFLRTNLHLGLPSGQIPYEFFSYPSGHAARTAFISGVLIFVILLSKRLDKFQKRLLICAVLFFDAVMFISRVYLGEHWLSDVIGGALLGFSLALVAAYFINVARGK